MNYNLDYGNAEAMAATITKLVGEVEAAMDKVNNAFSRAGETNVMGWFAEETEDWNTNCAGHVATAKEAMRKISEQITKAAETASEIENQ